MATQYAPIAKDSSINTTENTPRNIADVLAEELSAIEQAIASGSGSGGHTIVNASGTDMTQRAKMQFADAKVTDDSTEQATKVEVVQLIDDESELTNAPDGVYQGDYEDAPEDVLDASMVAYGNGSVEDALDDLNGLSVQRVIIYSDYNFTANTNSYISNLSLTVPSGYELVAVLNIHFTDVATKPVFLRSWYQNVAGAKVVIYWSNTGSSVAVGNIEAEMLLKPVV